MDQGRFERLYEAHARPLLAFLTYRTHDLGLAEDLLADTFERVLSARGRFDPRKSSEKTWLYTIALNCLRDHQRRRSAEQRALERAEVGTGLASSPSPDDVDQREVLSRALAALSEEEREVIALRYGADLTVPEIARLTRQRLTTVEGRVYRSLRKLRENLHPADTEL